jgi:metal-dependent HD superfamily phosphatase/phosphodiesterase
VVKLADALDLTKGRARLPVEASRHFGAATPVPVVEEVTIQRHKSPPVRVVLRMARAEELPAVEALLQSKLEQAALAGLVDMVARLSDERGGALQPLRVWMTNDD